MKKSTRILKRYLITFLVVLMSIENFAAVVGDNDGAAFITNELSAYLIQFNFSEIASVKSK